MAERDDGEVLTATNKSKALDFKIPKQFSVGAIRKYIQRTAVDHDDDYGRASGVFPLWLVQRSFTNQAERSCLSCV